MIGIYVDEAVHADIKAAAESQNKTMTEYLVELHLKELNNEQPTIMHRINQMEAIIRQLYTEITGKQIETTETVSSNQSITVPQKRQSPFSVSLQPAKQEVTNVFQQPTDISNAWQSNPVPQIEKPLKETIKEPVTKLPKESQRIDSDILKELEKLTTTEQFNTILQEFNKIDERAVQPAVELLQIILQHTNGISVKNITEIRGSRPDRPLQTLFEMGIIAKKKDQKPMLIIPNLERLH
jgi:hypothetical protein